MTSEHQCGICGRKAKRPCPGLTGWICPACCGSHRGSKINCAQDCAFFPFGVAAYDTWLKIDGEWMVKAAKYVLTRCEKTEFDRILKQLSIRTSEPSADREASFTNAVYFTLFVRRDGEGKTLSDLWESESWQSLDNDEQIMTRFRRRSLVTVVEIQKKVDALSVECIDLFEREPRPFRLFDRILAAGLPRFTRLLVWLTHFPHFSHTSGFAYPVPLIYWSLWRDQIQAATNNQARQRPGLTTREWLSENLALAVALVRQIAATHRQQLLNALNTHHCLALYELVGNCEEIDGLLKSKPDFKSQEPKPDPDVEPPKAFYRWQLQGESAEFDKDSPKSSETNPEDSPDALGAVWLYPNVMMIETWSKRKFEFAKKTVERYFGSLLRFQREQIIDLAQQSRERQAAEYALDQATQSSAPGQAGSAGQSNAALPSPEIERQRLQQDHHKRYSEFLDTKSAALGDLTPRDAAKNAAARPKLVELMKIQLHNLDRENAQSGLDFRLDHVLDELGLPELK